MSSEQPPAKPLRSKTAKAKSSAKPKAADPTPPPAPNPPAPVAEPPSLVGRLTRLPGAVADTVTDTLRKVTKTAETPWRVGKALLLSPEQAEAMKETGEYLRDLRLVAGLTLDDLNAALDLKDLVAGGRGERHGGAVIRSDPALGGVAGPARSGAGGDAAGSDLPA